MLSACRVDSEARILGPGRTRPPGVCRSGPRQGGWRQMIYEFRTYTLKPRTLPEFLQRFGDALPPRSALSRLAAFWYTEIGPLNQVIHVWAYENVLERSRIRAEAVRLGIWPPKTHDLIVDMRSEIFEPLPFSPPLEPSSHGPFFEMRSYALKPAST